MGINDDNIEELEQEQEQEQVITFEEFSKVRLKIGKVIQTENMPGMKKVFKATIDLGNQRRDLAVGGALHYRPEEFVGRYVVVCTNLQPKKIGNMMSNGMLLAADGPDGRPVFLTVTEDVSPGASIH
ncbi:MAG TPA: methionine--tRNA ligase [Nitrososphaera sp.]|nr:methionine--tRNA ligase [Nitrososphaera sp.]